jgi:hypothetical protein
LLQFDSEKTIEGMLEADIAMMVAPLNHGRPLRRETLEAPGSPRR